MAKGNKGAEAQNTDETLMLEQALVKIEELNQLVDELTAENAKLTAKADVKKPIVNDTKGNMYAFRGVVVKHNRVDYTAKDLQEKPEIVDELVKKGSGMLLAINKEVTN